MAAASPAKSKSGSPEGVKPVELSQIAITKQAHDRIRAYAKPRGLKIFAVVNQALDALERQPAST